METSTKRASRRDAILEHKIIIRDINAGPSAAEAGTCANCPKKSGCHKGFFPGRTAGGDDAKFHTVES